MVARGDLGAELPIEEVPLLQVLFISMVDSKVKFELNFTGVLSSVGTEIWFLFTGRDNQAVPEHGESCHCCN